MKATGTATRVPGVQASCTNGATLSATLTEEKPRLPLPRGAVRPESKTSSQGVSWDYFRGPLPSKSDTFAIVGP